MVSFSIHKASSDSIYQPGSLVSSHFNAAIVAASYFASFCGCLLTIEMLHRRGTALGNLRSWLETLACATAMGLVGIWCMHFIGNRAIILGNGDTRIQLVYNPGYTTLSVFLPIIGLTIAFSAAEVYSKSKMFHWALLICCGVFAGLSITGMHYIGNFGISNYYLTYAHRYLAASIVIAIGDSVLVLMLFYTWREKWINSWWKRLSCAIVLAGGVCAMHFTASTSCQYTFRHFNEPGAIHSRNTQVSVAGALCAAAAITVLGVLFLTRHRRMVLKRTSQKVMLACAMFDTEGRILVTTEGVLPAQEITDKYNHRSFDEDFDNANSAFQWIFRVTRNWSAVIDLIPKMTDHINAHKDDGQNNTPPASSASSVIYDPETYNDYSIIFRERFCAAAAHLASSFNMPLERIGVLYDKIVETGTLKPDDKIGRRQLHSEHDFEDLENGDNSNVFGKGQLLFLTKQLGSDDTERLLNAGYRFAHVQQVSRNIAQTMQIPLSALESHVAGIKHYVDNHHNLEKTGTWLSIFAIIPKLYNKGFDVVVRKAEQDQLPDVKILSTVPEPWQAQVFSRLDGLRARQCLAVLEDKTRVLSNRAKEEKKFLTMLQYAIVELGELVPSEWFRDARFFAKPIHAHYSESTRSRAVVTTMYAFCVIADIHTPIDVRLPISRVPLSFFGACQRCYAGSPDHSVLAHDIHQEFGPLLARKTNSKPTLSSLKSVVSHKSRNSHLLNKTRSDKTVQSQRSESIGASDASSAREVVISEKSRNNSRGVIPSRRPAHNDHENSWGGILVNSETFVRTDTEGEYSNEAKVGLGVGIEVAVGTSKQEDTFVDELTAVTKARFVPRLIGY
ncbi:Hypothetical protein R9X50_00489800 [Acrodontium crateriforme]|uniref:MHYT domain-containing protein n=1 Tax=Acrodontium crateriforme TaxID=150365 RepID=A0AAQ3M6D7_9PEZI|nr:Hypothetical protein R9X50_00489800 [Acrodontium crateriforme]